MEQPLNERRQLLQTKIFAHPTAVTFNSYSQAVLSKLSRCHTAAIGVHHYQCSNASCSHLHYQYHSCGNRHCPGCGGTRRAQWIEDRMGELLPTTYFHLVFTLPQELRSLCMGNRKLLFGLLFEAAQHTITTLAKDEKYIGATPAITSILHTHGQDLSFHPHTHNIVSGGGIDGTGKWIKERRANGRFLFPRRAMEKYLGRYTHKVAITAHRILQIDDSHISFKYKDYADGNKQKIMALTHPEFLRRFEQHILPKGFVKIRHAGYLHAKNKMERIASVCAQLRLPAPMQRIRTPAALRLLLQTGKDISRCPVCGQGRMELIKTLIYYNGCLVDVAQLRNRGSPKIKMLRLTGIPNTYNYYFLLETKLLLGRGHLARHAAKGKQTCYWKMHICIATFSKTLQNTLQRSQPLL